ncbi:hypothetical protein [Streptomyces harbinensis]|uniref:hypothetical protein n=1 Tax=Streptomyces harbinensis TaxID=1176198 RepID=UPI0036CFFDA9
MDVPDGLDDLRSLPVRTFDRWDFLTMPFLHLQVATRTEVREVAAPDLGFMGEIKEARNPAIQWRLFMPIGQDPLERDMVARGLLAAAHGVDVSDWPVAMRFAGGRIQK